MLKSIHQVGYIIHAHSNGPYAILSITLLWKSILTNFATVKNLLIVISMNHQEIQTIFITLLIIYLCK